VNAAELDRQEEGTLLLAVTPGGVSVTFLREGAGWTCLNDEAQSSSEEIAQGGFRNARLQRELPNGWEWYVYSWGDASTRWIYHSESGIARCTACGRETTKYRGIGPHNLKHRA